MKMVEYLFVNKGKVLISTKHVTRFEVHLISSIVAVSPADPAPDGTVDPNTSKTVKQYRASLFAYITVGPTEHDFLVSSEPIDNPKVLDTLESELLTKLFSKLFD